MSSSPGAKLILLKYTYVGSIIIIKNNTKTIIYDTVHIAATPLTGLKIHPHVAAFLPPTVPIVPTSLTTGMTLSYKSHEPETILLIRYMYIAIISRIHTGNISNVKASTTIIITMIVHK